MRDTPFISVIMNGYNGEAFLRQAIESVLAQTWQDWEIIFWDNQSTDQTAAIVASYNDPRIRYFYAPTHTLLYEARNYAIAEAKGDFYAFLDVDDWWHPEKLAQQISLFRDPEVGLAYSNYWLVTTGERVAYRAPLPHGHALDALLRRYTVALLTLIVRREAFVSLSEGFNPNYHIIGDFDLVIRLAAQWKIAVLDTPLAYYRLHGNNETGKHRQRQLNEMADWIDHMKQHYPAIVANKFFSYVGDYRTYLEGMAAVTLRQRPKAWAAFWQLPYGRYKARLLRALFLPTALLRRLKK